MESKKGKRARKIRSCQSSLPSMWRGYFLATKKQTVAIMTPTNNQNTEQDQDKGDTVNDWQEFVYKRQEKLDKDLQSGEIPNEHTEIMNQVNEQLKGQPAELSDAVTLLVLSATYKHYNKGFYDGMRIAAIVDSL